MDCTLTRQNATPPGQWPEVARNWKHISSPLRPSTEDVESYSQVINLWTQTHFEQTPRGLILGVTPELYALPWPDHAILRAADRTQAMIDYVWPGQPEAAIHGDWLDLDLPHASIDILLSDGGLSMLDYSGGQQALIHDTSRMLAPGGLAAFRLYVPPARKESVDHVFKALNEGTIPNLNCLKLRLGMAMQPSPEQGTALADVWEALREQAGSGWKELADRLGWHHEHLGVIDAYRHSQARYYFVSAEQTIALFENAGLTHVKSTYHKYEMGDQCPVVVFQKPG